MITLPDYKNYLDFSLDQFQVYQLTKLKKFIKIIKNKSVYYKNKLSDVPSIQNYNDFESLPYLEQETLRNTSVKNMTATKWDELITISSSSGTTGKSKLVFWTNDALIQENKWTSLGYLLMSLRKNSRFAMTMPLELSRCPAYIEAARAIGAFSIPFGRIRNDLEMDNVIDKMKNLGVTHILGSTSRLLSLTQRAKDLGLNLKKDFKLTHIIGCAYFISNNTRRFLEQEWNAIFYDTYGANEISFAAGECEAHDGMHLLPGMSYVEVVDSNNGKQILDNKSTGEILVTNFSNLGTPLLRYRIGDLGSISYKKCICGLSFPRIFIKGRTAFTLYIGGTKLEAYEIDSVMAKFSSITNSYQAVVTKKKDLMKITFRVECYDIKKVSLYEKNNLEKELEKASYEVFLKVQEGVVTMSLELVPLGMLERTDRDKVKDQVVYKNE